MPVNKRDPSTVDPSAIRFFEGNWIALLAAALVWFNFSSIFSAHARPTWDVWVIPFYIWAIFFAGRNNWFTAGVLIGVGAMLKGQQLVIAPFFLLWPLFSLRFGAMLRWLIGLALAAGLIVSPWQVWLTPKRGPLLLCIAGVLIGPTIWMAMRMIPFTRRWTTPRRPTGRVGSAVARMLPFTRRFFTPDRILAPVVAGDPILSTNESPNATSFEPDPAPSIVRQVISAVFDFARARWPIWISAFCLAAALWLSPVLFATSTAWLKIGFIYGVDKMPSLETGSPASFAAILQHHFDWNSDDVVSLPFTKWTPTMKSLLAMIGYVLIAISAAAAAWHARNHDRRFLLAVAAPWLVYFTIFPEMHERYLLWASLMTAAAVAVNVGLTGLNLLLTAFSWSMAIDQLLRDGKPRGFGIGISRTFGRSLTRFTHSIIPDSGWAILVICVIWLWMMFSTPKRRRKPKPVLLADRSAV